MNQALEGAARSFKAFDGERFKAEELEALQGHTATSLRRTEEGCWRRFAAAPLRKRSSEICVVTQSTGERMLWKSLLKEPMAIPVDLQRTKTNMFKMLQIIFIINGA